MVAQPGRNAARKTSPSPSLPSPSTAETAHAAIRLARPEPTSYRHDTRDAPAPGLSGVQKAVAHAVVDSGGFGVGWCFKSTALLAEEVAFSPRSVDSALAALAAKGWLFTQVRRLPSLTVAVRHYRLTPVPSDLATSDEREAILAAAREASCERQRVRRKRVGSRVQQGPLNKQQGLLSVTARAAERTAGAAAEYLEDPEGASRAGRAVPAPSFAMVTGVRVPMPPRAAHAGYEPAVRLMLDAKAPHLAECAYAVSMLGAEYGMSLLEIGDAVLRLAHQYGAEATPAHLEAVLGRCGHIPASRRSKAREWLQRIGVVYDAVPAAAE